MGHPADTKLLLQLSTTHQHNGSMPVRIQAFIISAIHCKAFSVIFLPASPPASCTYPTRTSMTPEALQTWQWGDKISNILPENEPSLSYPFIDRIIRVTMNMVITLISSYFLSFCSTHTLHKHALQTVNILRSSVTSKINMTSYFKPW